MPTELYDGCAGSGSSRKVSRNTGPSLKVSIAAVACGPAKVKTKLCCRGGSCQQTPAIDCKVCNADLKGEPKVRAAHFGRRLMHHKRAAVMALCSPGQR